MPRSFKLHRAHIFAGQALLAAVMSGWGHPARAEDPLLDKAAALMRQNNSAGAYSSLIGAEAQRAGDPGFDYLLGVSALDSGHLTPAIFALERAVASRPDDALARAELARAYLAAGETDNARAELEQVRRSTLPLDVAAAIDRVLGVVNQVAPSMRPHASGYLELGAGYDTNVNSATGQGSFAIPAFGGLLLSTAPETQRQHDWFLGAAGGAEGNVPLAPGWKFVASGNLRGTLNRTVHDMNSDVLDLTAGLNHVAGVNAQTVALQDGTAWVGSTIYRTANGATAQWQLQLDAASQASVFGQWSRQVYPSRSERNTDRSVLGLGYARDFPVLGTLVYGSGYLADERTRNEGFEYFGHHAVGVRAGAERRLGAASVISVEWQYERRRYGGAEPLFDVRREDRQNQFSAQLNYHTTEHWQIVPQVRYTRAASNVVLYDYSRTVLQITFRREFI